MGLSMDKTRKEVVSEFFVGPSRAGKVSACRTRSVEVRPNNKVDAGTMTDNALPLVPYGPTLTPPPQGYATAFLEIIDELNYQLSHLYIPPPVVCVYNPTVYARHTLELYIRRYCDTPKHIMYLGMNPGPWGMSQTGIPFGEVNAVRDWLGIEGPVQQPPRVLPSRPILGFNCTRSEVSGQRFWELFRLLCRDPENFFSTSFVYNYLPQQWLKQDGCNTTPSDFRARDIQMLYDLCDPVLCRVVELYHVRIVVAMGRFAEARALQAFKEYLPDKQIHVLYLPHPSPRVPQNQNWIHKTIELMRESGLLNYYHPLHLPPID